MHDGMKCTQGMPFEALPHRNLWWTECFLFGEFPNSPGHRRKYTVAQRAMVDGKHRRNAWTDELRIDSAIFVDLRRARIEVPHEDRAIGRVEKFHADAVFAMVPDFAKHTEGSAVDVEPERPVRNEVV